MSTYNNLLYSKIPEYTNIKKVKLFSYFQLFVTPWTRGCQALLSMVFSRQDYCSELPFPAPGDLPNPAREPMSPALQVDFLPSDPPGKLTKNKHKKPEN